jgi:predicted ATPase
MQRLNTDVPLHVEVINLRDKPRHSITSIEFKNFKGLENFSIRLAEFNVLVGPNNSGKSSVLDALRVLWGAYRIGLRKTSKLISVDGIGSVRGYEIPRSAIPIPTDNVHTDYNDEPTELIFTHTTGSVLRIVFPRSGQAVMELKPAVKPIPRTTREFAQAFPLRIAIVPMLAPFEHDEELVNEDYVDRWSFSHRAARLFRNIWLQNDDLFDDFNSLLKRTWSGVTVRRPRLLDAITKKLEMKFAENGKQREISSAGFGLQIWMQLLSHLVRAKEDADVIVVDEPEIYLHPDLQRKIVSLLRDCNATVLVATHSVELINEVQPNEVILMERRQKEAKRLTDLTGLQRAVEMLGSAQNMQLTRLARSKRVLFVEGSDGKLLRQLAEILGHDAFTTEHWTIIPLGGFTQWPKASSASWTFSEVLGEPITCAAIFDRDYRSDDETEDFIAKRLREIDYVHVLERKELENYLLVPDAIDRAIRARQHIKQKIGAISVFKLLDEATESERDNVLASRISALTNFQRSRGTDLKTVVTSESKRLAEIWGDLSERLKVVPGKTVLSNMNRILSAKFGFSLTTHQIISNLQKCEIATELAALFDELNEINTKASKHSK